PARSILTVERTALNLVQRMSGVSTLTAKYVDAVKDTDATILDTRKTIPGWRELDKYATRMGGAQNHRMRLDDMVMIKDNHVALAGSIAEAVAKVRKATSLPIVLEVDTLEQLKEAIPAKPERVLLDNMTPTQLKEAVAITAGALPL